MAQQKIDQLFREGLSSYEETPSPEAWINVEQRLGSKHGPTRSYWAAVSISLLIIFWMAWPQQTVRKGLPIASGVTYPKLENNPSWNIPQAEKEEKNQEALLQPRLTVKQQKVRLTAREATTSPQMAENEESIESLLPDLTSKIIIAPETQLPALKDEHLGLGEQPKVNFFEVGI